MLTIKHKSKKRKIQVEVEDHNENEEYTYDESEVNGTSTCLLEADITQLPPHLFENLKKIKCTIDDDEQLTAEEIQSAVSEDGEVWLIQCPQNISPSELFSGKKISLGNENVSRLNTLTDPKDLEELMNNSLNSLTKERQTTYEALSMVNEGTMDNLVTLVPDSEGNRRMIAAPLAGHICIKESLLNIPKLEFCTKPKLKKQLPFKKNLKHRHPVYGVEFTHAIETKIEVRNKKKKNKEKEKVQNVEYEEECYREATPIKTKENGEVKNLEYSEDIFHKKRKRKVQDLEWEEEDSNEIFHKKKKRKVQDLEWEEEDSKEIFHKKKKKKRSHD